MRSVVLREGGRAGFPPFQASCNYATGLLAFGVWRTGSSPHYNAMHSARLLISSAGTATALANNGWQYLTRILSTSHLSMATVRLKESLACSDHFSYHSFCASSANFNFRLKRYKQSPPL